MWKRYLLLRFLYTVYCHFNKRCLPIGIISYSDGARAVKRRKMIPSYFPSYLKISKLCVHIWERVKRIRIKEKIEVSNPHNIRPRCRFSSMNVGMGDLQQIFEGLWLWTSWLSCSLESIYKYEEHFSVLSSIPFSCSFSLPKPYVRPYQDHKIVQSMRMVSFYSFFLTGKGYLLTTPNMLDLRTIEEIKQSRLGGTNGAFL